MNSLGYAIIHLGFVIFFFINFTQSSDSFFGYIWNFGAAMANMVIVGHHLSNFSKEYMATLGERKNEN